METIFTLCRVCKKVKMRISDGIFNSKNKRWRDEHNKLWSGKYCPDCNKERVKIKMRTTPRKKYSKVKDLYSNMSKEEIQVIKLKNRERNRKYMSKRLKEDLNFKISHNLRSRLYNIIKRNSKIGSAVKDLGCSIDELKLLISNKFIETMSWDNYGEWEIDHIIPLSKFDLTIREEFLKACNYSNLQPLWKDKNRSKGNK